MAVSGDDLKPVTTFNDNVLGTLSDDPEKMLGIMAELDDAFQAFAHRLDDLGVLHKLNFTVEIRVSREGEDE